MSAGSDAAWPCSSARWPSWPAAAAPIFDHGAEEVTACCGQTTSTARPASCPPPRAGASTSAPTGATTSSSTTPTAPRTSPSTAAATWRSPPARSSYEGCAYTSGRINTRGLFAQARGRFEARLKLPVGRGLWPAFWLLGDDLETVGWPACGEIDIMEYRGQEPNMSSTAACTGPATRAAAPITGRFVLPGNGFDAGFHVFAIEWTADEHHLAGRRPGLPAPHGRRPAAGRALGLQPPLLHHPEPRRRRQLRRPPRRDARNSPRPCWWTGCASTASPPTRGRSRRTRLGRSGAFDLGRSRGFDLSRPRAATPVRPDPAYSETCRYVRISHS